MIDTLLPIHPQYILPTPLYLFIHVEEVGILLATDQAIWDHAVANAQTIITKDEDFKNILLLGSPPKTPVVWIRIGNCSNAALMQWFQPLFPQILAYLEQGEYLIELY